MKQQRPKAAKVPVPNRREGWGVSDPLFRTSHVATRGAACHGQRVVSRADLSIRTKPSYRMDNVMSSIQVFIDIDRPLIDVWDQVSRLEGHAHWMGDVDSITFEDGQVSGVGTTMKVLTRVGPFTTTDVIVVEEWNAPHSIVVSHQGLVSGHGAFHLEAQGFKTRFMWCESLSFPWYLGGGITAAAARPILARIWRANLRRFAATLN
jgi:hypothetical protein